MFLTEQFRGLDVRFLTAPNGKPVVIAADVIAGLKGDKTNTSQILKKYVRDKWVIDMPNPNGGKAVKCLFEPGVYQLCGNPMFQTEFAFQFQDWVFEDVLPKLRASGGYIMPNATSEQLEALRLEVVSLQKAIASGEGTLNLVREFFTKNIKYSPKGWVTMGDCLKRYNKQYPDNELTYNEFLPLVARVIKENPVDKSKRPYMCKRNGFNDIENASFVPLKSIHLWHFEAGRAMCE